MKNKYFTFNTGTFLSLSGVFYVAYSILLDDGFFFLSVAAIIDRAAELSIEQHLIVLGFIPVYVAIVIFGSAMIGFYLGGILEKVLIQPLKNKTSSMLKFIL